MNMTAMNMPATEAEQDAAAQLIGQYAERSTALPGNDVARVRSLRDAGIAGLKERGLPHRRVEEWKYTDLRRAMIAAFPSAGAATNIGMEEVREALGELAGLDALTLIFVNGALSGALSDRNGTPKGVEMHTLGNALKSPPEWLLSALEGSNAPENEIVGQLNAAFMSDGVVLRIGKGVKFDRPVHLVHLSAADAPHSASLRNVLIVEEGAEAVFIESYVSFAGTIAQINAVTDIRLADGARLQHYKFSGENRSTQHLASANVILGEKADYLGVNFASGNALSRHQSFIKFAGEAAKAHFGGMQLMRGTQHCDMTLVVDHAAVGCESREHVKAVLDDDTQGIFQAKVIVQPGAQQTDGRQMAQALLLSETAEFDAKPELEIYADDVKCNHGATSGALDEDLMFYLLSRGIPEDQAKSLLILAFIGEVLDQVQYEPLRTALEAKASLWLAASE